MKDDRLYLLHIAECVVEQYIRGGRSEFLQDTKTQDSVLRNLQTLAESTQRLSKSFKEKHPAIDWRGLAGLRNILVHDYLGLNLSRVWSLVEKHLPELKRQAESALGEGSASDV